MLMVLEALVPCHLQKLKSNTVTMESASAARDEIAAIADLATSLQALLYSTEALTRSDSFDMWLFFPHANGPFGILFSLSIMSLHPGL